MVIIFEGHDKSGKTTIAKRLSEELGIPTFKVQRDKYNWDRKHNLHYGTEQITQFIEQTKSPVIIDRFHGSDYMYDRLFDRELQDAKVFELDTRLAELGTVIILCYKNEEQYEVDEEDKEFVDPSMYTDMTMHYRNFLMKGKCKFIVLNTSSMDIEEQIRELKNQLEEVQWKK